jgi:hypothetical protein
VVDVLGGLAANFKEQRHLLGGGAFDHIERAKAGAGVEDGEGRSSRLANETVSFRGLR